jgi:hypothetical protein
MARTPTKTTPRARKQRRDWRPKFLAALATEGTVWAASKSAGVHRSTVYEERQRNEDFALAWADVEERVTEGLERKAVDMAMGGEVRMLEFLLKARRPLTYRERVDVNHSGKVKHDLADLSDEELDRLADRLEAQQA